MHYRLGIPFLCILLTMLLFFLCGCQVEISPNAPGTTLPDTAPVSDPSAGTYADSSDRPQDTVPAADTYPAPPETGTASETEHYGESVVITGAVYEYPVIDAFQGGPYLDGDGNPWMHTFTYPALTVDTPNANAFNQKLAAFAWDERKKAETGKAENIIYGLSYEVMVRDNVVGLILHLWTSPQYSEGYSTPYCFYYDLYLDKELNKEEYLYRVGASEQMMLEHLLADPVFKEDCTIFGCSPTVEDFLDETNPDYRLLAQIYDDSGDAIVVVCVDAFYTRQVRFALNSVMFSR